MNKREIKKNKEERTLLKVKNIGSKIEAKVVKITGSKVILIEYFCPYCHNPHYIAQIYARSLRSVPMITLWCPFCRYKVSFSKSLQSSIIDTFDSADYHAIKKIKII